LPNEMQSLFHRGEAHSSGMGWAGFRGLFK